MSVTYKPLSDQDRKSLHEEAIEAYLHGGSFAFALALHRELKYPLVGLMEGREIRHAGVLRGGRHFDIRGEVSKEEFGKPFGISPVVTRLIREEELRALRPIDPSALDSAVGTAQALWPEFPWREGPLRRYEAFLAELEELSKKHGVYVFAPYVTAWPILTEAHGNEKGYILTPAHNGRQYFFDRKF